MGKYINDTAAKKHALGKEIHAENKAKKTPEGLQLAKDRTESRK
jgi:hypothetical protein